MPLTPAARSGDTDRLGADGPARILLEVPATPASLAVVRAAVAAAVARMGVTVDDVDDLRLAVSEAGTLLIERAAPASALHVRLHGDGTRVRVQLHVPVQDPDDAPEESFAWTVLTALATTATHRIDMIDGRPTLSIEFDHTVQIPA